MNSAYFGLRDNISSIRHALALLGIRETKKWISMTALSGLAKDKPEELVVTSTLRAKLCEDIAPKTGLRDRSPELFLMGMFSMVDAIMDRPMSDIVSKLPLNVHQHTQDTLVVVLLGLRSHQAFPEPCLPVNGSN